ALRARALRSRVGRVQARGSRLPRRPRDGRRGRGVVRRGPLVGHRRRGLRGPQDRLGEPDRSRLSGGAARARRPGRRYPSNRQGDTRYSRNVTLSRQELEEWKRTTEKLPQKTPEPNIPPDQEAFMRLQNGVGNAALARAMMQRDYDLSLGLPKVGAPEPAP